MTNSMYVKLKIGAEIFKRALSYPARQIAKNAGVNGNVVIEKVQDYSEIFNILFGSLDKRLIYNFRMILL